MFSFPLCGKTNWPEGLPEVWRRVLPPADRKKMESLGRKLGASNAVFPPEHEWFSAFESCSPSALKVLLLGQDPYHGHGQAHGLAFSVRHGTQEPPSLRNILKEKLDDVGGGGPGFGQPGVLSGWAEQGVLLLNRVLTVPPGEAGGHGGWGWEELSEAVVQWASIQNRPLVVVLWGKWAQSLSGHFDLPAHLVLCAPHPSPLSAHRGFWGSKPFSQTNKWLHEHGLEPVDWDR